MAGKRSGIGVGVGEREPDTIFNVPLSDPKIVEAGLNPSDLYGKGISWEELEKRLEAAKKAVGVRKKIK